MTELEKAQLVACRLYFMIRMLAQEGITPGQYIADWALDILTDAGTPIEIYGDAFLDHKAAFSPGGENGSRTD